MKPTSFVLVIVPWVATVPERFAYNSLILYFLFTIKTLNFFECSLKFVWYDTSCSQTSPASIFPEIFLTSTSEKSIIILLYLTVITLLQSYS